MERANLTVRVPRDLLENAKRYASENHTTLTDLIVAYLDRIPAQQSLADAPIVSRLRGVLSKNISVDDYREHLEDKLGGSLRGRSNLRDGVGSKNGTFQRI